MAEGPVFGLHLNQIDINILRPQSSIFGETRGDVPIERLFLHNCTGIADSNLDDLKIIAALNIEIMPPVIEIWRVMLCRRVRRKISISKPQLRTVRMNLATLPNPISALHSTKMQPIKASPRMANSASAKSLVRVI